MPEGLGSGQAQPGAALGGAGGKNQLGNHEILLHPTGSVPGRDGAAAFLPAWGGISERRLARNGSVTWEWQCHLGMAVSPGNGSVIWEW